MKRENTNSISPYLLSSIHTMVHTQHKSTLISQKFLIGTSNDSSNIYNLYITHSYNYKDKVKIIKTPKTHSNWYSKDPYTCSH